MSKQATGKQSRSYSALDDGLFSPSARFTTLRVHTERGALEIPASQMMKEAMISRETTFHRLSLIIALYSRDRDDKRCKFFCAGQIGPYEGL